MNATKFKKANKLLLIGGDPTTKPLAVYTDGHTCVSEWELTDEDIASLAISRRIQLVVRAEPTKHPAVALYVGDVIPTILKP